MEKKIIKFLEHQRVAGICCLDESGLPYCFSCFYAFDPEENIICFKTKAQTKHGSFLEGNSAVAGTIQPDKLNPLAIQGIQFNGRMNIDTSLLDKANQIYHRKFPFALTMAGEVKVIELDSLKMTDNTLGFGKKLFWERPASLIL